MAAKLTENQLKEFSRLLNNGLKYKQIGRILTLSEDGVQRRVSILCRELGVDNKAAALRRAKHLGWLNTNEDKETK